MRIQYLQKGGAYVLFQMKKKKNEMLGHLERRRKRKKLYLTS